MDRIKTLKDAKKVRSDAHAEKRAADKAGDIEAAMSAGFRARQAKRIIEVLDAPAQVIEEDELEPKA